VLLVPVGVVLLVSLAHAVIVRVARLGGGAHAERPIRDVLSVLVLLVLIAGAVGLVRRGGSAAAVHRKARRAERRHSVASRWDLFRTGSRWAVRRQLRVLRPSLAGLPWWRRLRVPTCELATPLARVGRATVWSPIEDVTLRLGGPRVGKSGELGCRILDAPGAVIATSTRTDLFEHTAPLRSRRGPVWLFNPSGLGELASTVAFDPLTGCTIPKAAFERARDLIDGAEATAGSDPRGEREYWTSQAARVLAALLHAAALGGASMRDVHGWVANPDAHAGDIQRYLRASSEPASFEAELTQFVKTNDRTRSSITTTIMPALSWLHDPTAAAAAGQEVGRRAPILDPTGAPLPDDPEWEVLPPGLDVAALLAQSGTVYLLGAQDAQVAPLVTALTGHLARTARALANRSPGGRLDPPLALVLDEVALICPIPLPEWTADMGGRNITIHIATQSEPQLRARWGADGAAAIKNNAATVLLYGGTRDADDLHGFATLLGDRPEPVATVDHAGRITSATTHRVPVLPPALLSQLGKGEVVIIHRGMPPALGSVAMVWARRDVRRERRRRARAATRAHLARRARAGWAHTQRCAVALAAAGARLEAGLRARAPRQRDDELHALRRAGDGDHLQRVLMPPVLDHPDRDDPDGRNDPGGPTDPAGPAGSAGPPRRGEGR
jgi:type IV secretion system protein VirD4